MLKSGDKGNGVLELQKMLTAAGFNPGPADGIFGPLTVGAVKVVQRHCGLPNDGIAGEQTLVALQLLVGRGAVPERKITEHFKEKEFACRCCGVLRINIRLVHMLEQLRTSLGGQPVTITSGYRCPRHNRRVGGAPASQHLKGNAADIVVQGAGSEKVAASGEELGFTGIGRYNNFTHVDVRDGQPVRWNG